MQLQTAVAILTPLADPLLAVGGVISVATKALALKDPSTTWTRRSSGFNVLAYPFTSLVPFAVLGLWATWLTSMLNFLIWLGIFIWRAPEDENLLGGAATQT